MRSNPRSLLLGAFACAMLVAIGGGGWVSWSPAPAESAPTSSPAQAEETALPLPPAPVRLSDDPEYDRCLDMLGYDPTGSAALAEAWETHGGGEAARHCAALAMLALGEAERAAPRLEQIGRTSTAGAMARAAVFGQAAQAWMIAGAPQRAYGAVTMALTLAPEDADLLIDRAVTSGVQSRYEEAMQDLDRALVLAPDRTDALVFRAAAARHLERPEAALADLEAALTIDPDSAEALLERGILKQMKGDPDGARQDWQRAIALAPDSPTADLAAQNIALNEAGPRRN